MRDEPNSILSEMEAEYGFQVLFAVESGSRAWGFASPDSDYDVRFLYVHPKDWYLDIRERSDTVERYYPGDIDCAGWELRKALRLFAGCNLSLCEWLGSPIVYQSHGALLGKMQSIAPAYFNPRKAIHHYLGTARGILHNHLNGDSIAIKKLFYIVRPLAAAAWIARGGTAPPVPFATLLEAGLLPESVENEVHALLETKREATEGYMIRISGGLLAWIEESFERLHMAAGDISPGSARDWAPLNEIFRDTLNESATGGR